MTPSDRRAWQAFVVGVQAMAVIAGVAINLLGWLVGVNYYDASLPFFLVGILGELVARRFLKESNIPNGESNETKQV